MPVLSIGHSLCTGRVSGSRYARTSVSSFGSGCGVGELMLRRREAALGVSSVGGAGLDRCPVLTFFNGRRVKVRINL